MVRDAEATARSAESIDTNSPGMCLQWCRERAEIPARHGTAAIAWANAERKQFDRQPPRGAFVFWTGGSRGFGHIAVSLGGGNLRSTDAGGTGRVATRTLAWFDANWPSQNYVGWADNVNGVTVPGVIDTRDGFDMADLEDLRRIVREELRDLEYVSKVAAHSKEALLDEAIAVTNASGTATTKTVKALLRETWQKIAKLT